MTADALKGFFSLLETEEEGFPALIKRFGIDPAKDFQNCDLSNVDFGRLIVDTLDLTGAILDGANLSQVRYKKLIGFEGVPPPRREKNWLNDVRAAVFRYQNSDWVLNQVLQRMSDSSAPILVFYDTAAEQDILTKRLCTHFTAHLINSAPSPMLGRLLWFYTKASRPQQFRLNAASLEKEFFELLRTESISHDIGVYPFMSNKTAVERICKSLSAVSYDKMRAQFARSLRRELAAPPMVELGVDRGSVAIFSGFSPISKRLYREIRSAGNGRLTMIFLCSSSLESFYQDQGGMPWRQIVEPAFSIGVPLTVLEDIARLKKRIGVVTEGNISISDDTDAWMRRYVGKPLTSLKIQLTDKLKEKIGAVAASDPMIL